MDKIFVDSDVVIDFLIDRQPFANDSSSIFDLAEKQKIEIWVSSLAINNIHYVIRKLLGKKKTKEVIRDLVELIEIQGVGKQEVLGALDSDIADFEDAMQHASAFQIPDVKAIITRNIRDYKKSKIAAFTPEMFLKTFDYTSQ